MMEHINSHYQAMQQIQMQQQAMMQGGKGGPGTALQQPGIGARPQEQSQSDQPGDGLKGLLSSVGLT